MTDQITLEEALKLVQFRQVPNGSWYVENVKGNVYGTINGREWQFVENPRKKLKRLIEEGADKVQLLEAFNQLEESND